MIIICPGCNKRYEIENINNAVDIDCTCGKNFRAFPWLSFRQIVKEEKKIECSLCGRTYNPGIFRNNTEIACSCGNLFVILI